LCCGAAHDPGFQSCPRLRHGFELGSPARKSVLLKTYWNIPDRQVEMSVVLANPPDDEAKV
jgi:hypothetical protein